VIIPTQGSQLDANEASRAIRVVMQSQKLTETETPYAVLLTRTSPLIRTRGLQHIQKGLIEAGIPVFETEVINELDVSGDAIQTSVSHLGSEIEPVALPKIFPDFTVAGTLSA
jgi:hypothetical protein